MLALITRSRDTGIVILRHQVAVTRHQVKAPRRSWQTAPCWPRRPGCQPRQQRQVVSPRACCAGAPASSGGTGLRRAVPGPGSPWQCRRWPGTTHCRRIHDELADLGCKLAPPTGWQVLTYVGTGPAPTGPGQAWRAFPKPRP
ncbi:MAG TPA: hypothetical protein VI365_09880 [Trebonia sp.]